MNAKPENYSPPSPLDETIGFTATGMASDPGPDHARPAAAGEPWSAAPAPQERSPLVEGRHRYTFASGARPLDGFTIRRAIGRGGFGEVYYATSDSGKEVALKLITRNLDIERRGVVQCMNLKCPNLLAIHDIKGNDDGDTFVIMEYVAGPNLAQILAEHPGGLPLDDVRRWLRGLVDGVSYLHDHGIVHRDLKPANLFLEEGVVKIGDYGLSKLITSERVSHHSESIGTCHYMAPEIATGKYNKPIDIYAIGVILYEMIVGSVPFDGETVGEVLIKHLTTRPDLARLPEPYHAIVARALAKDPAHRPARVLDLLPPGDGPLPRDVRFVGDPHRAEPTAAPRSPVGAPERPGAAATGPATASKPGDEVLRINDEEPVLYIGPDTPTPVLPPAPVTPWQRRAYRREQRQVRRQERRQERRERRAEVAVARAGHLTQRVRLIATSPLLPPEPILPPDPLPVGRVRVGALAGSLVVAALWSTVGSLVAAALLGIDMPRHPQAVGLLFGSTLLLSWAALIGGKFTEGWRITAGPRRAGQFAVGCVVGLATLGLATWLLVEPPAAPVVLEYATFFGLVGLGVDWWNLTDRDRRGKFRVWPLVKVAIITAIPSLVFFPMTAHPLAAPSVLLSALIVQLAAPWDEAAARYTRAVERSRSSVA